MLWKSKRKKSKKEEKKSKKTEKNLSWLAWDTSKACVSSLSTHFLHDSLGYVHYVRFGVKVNLLVNWWFVGCSLVTWLSNSTLPNVFVHSFPLTLLPHITTQVLLIVLCTLHFSGGEFESPCKHMVVHFWNESWVSICYISNTWAGAIHISQSGALLGHFALLYFICLHDVLCASLGVIKFQIKLAVLYFFENLLLLILKCFASYLGLPLIDILACNML